MTNQRYPRLFFSLARWAAAGLVGAALIGGTPGVVAAGGVVFGGGLVALIVLQLGPDGTIDPALERTSRSAPGSDPTFSLLALGARWWPQWLWRTANFFVKVDVTVAGTTHSVPWFAVTQLPIVTETARVKVSYSAPSWGPSSHAELDVQPGDHLVYCARALPWRKGSLKRAAGDSGETADRA